MFGTQTSSSFSIRYLITAILLIGISSTAHAAAIVRRQTINFDYPYGESDVSIVYSTVTEKFLYSQGVAYAFDSELTVGLVVRANLTKKVVGIRFSNDTGATFDEVTAKFHQRIKGQEYEDWIATIYRGLRYSYDPPVEYEYNGFVTLDGGERIYDPYGKYYMFKKPTVAAPMVLLNDALEYDAASRQVLLNGTVRTYSNNKDKDYVKGKIIIRWSLDKWVTRQDTEAIPPTASSDTWTFKVPFSNTSTPLPESLNYVIRFRPAASSSSIFLSTIPAKEVRPTYSYYGDDNAISEGRSINGIQPLVFTFSSGIEIGSPLYRINNDSFTPMPNGNRIVIRTGGCRMVNINLI
ncbi:hypothetical protein BC829DRAFT_148278 [Chytridium lagenaria]|nr:hypothetical protein BC829DRAFT_148278 [Chytridium lagenaria]